MTREDLKQANMVSNFKHTLYFLVSILISGCTVVGNSQPMTYYYFPMFDLCADVVVLMNSSITESQEKLITCPNPRHGKPIIMNDIYLCNCVE